MVSYLFNNKVAFLALPVNVVYTFAKKISALEKTHISGHASTSEIAGHMHVTHL